MANQDMSLVIAERRKALRMTQTELAEKLNVSDQTVSRWETGAGYPDASIIPALAEALQIDIATLFSKTPKAETLAEGDKTDGARISRFRVESFVGGALILFACIFAYLITKVPFLSGAYWAFFILAIVLVLAGLLTFGGGYISFQDFYRGKFYNDRYKAIGSHGALAISVLTVLFCYVMPFSRYAVAPESRSWIVYLPVVAEVAIFLVLIPFGKKDDMQLPRNWKSVVPLCLGLAFCLAGEAFLAMGMTLVWFVAYGVFEAVGLALGIIALLRLKPRKN
ncbi:MAG: helix-turn-helix domain-containing protein [Bacilli bacterium]|jgi:transcriptional regulator with XRE-family HTH domain|nr:helix-turn-helix domain-containing protein [Bacilli bacterium]